MRKTKVRNRARKHTAKRTLKKTFTIAGEILKVHLRDNCEPDFDWVNLRKKAGDQIRWLSKGPEFTIHFEDSPFADEHGNKKCDFIVPARGHADSGPPILGEADDDYEYTVERIELAMSADPGLSVRP
jgi:hypothetical protein